MRMREKFWGLKGINQLRFNWGWFSKIPKFRDENEIEISRILATLLDTQVKIKILKFNIKINKTDLTVDFGVRTICLQQIIL